MASAAAARAASVRFGEIRFYHERWSLGSFLIHYSLLSTSVRGSRAPLSHEVIQAAHQQESFSGPVEGIKHPNKGPYVRPVYVVTRNNAKPFGN